MSLLQRVTVTRVRAGVSMGSDGHGNPIPGAPVLTPIPNCSMQPGAAPEVLGNRDTTGIAWTVFAAGAVDVESTDRIRLPGDSRDYEIDGEPLRWPAGLALSAQTVILLRRWEES